MSCSSWGTSVEGNAVIQCGISGLSGYLALSSMIEMNTPQQSFKWKMIIYFTGLLAATTPLFLILQQSLEDWSKKTKTPKAVDWLLTWPAQRHAGCSLLFQLEITCKLLIFMYLCLLIDNPWIYLYVLKCLPIIRAASLWYPPHASSFFNI